MDSAAAIALAARPELDPVWPRLTAAQRREAAAWLEVVRRMEAAVDKAAECAFLLREKAGLKGLSRSGIYRRTKAFRERGVAGLVRADVAARAAQTGEAGLPPEFIAFWHGLCGLNQRKKAAAAYRALFFDHLMEGRVIPGYGTDWRGIWSREHPRDAVPAFCPYQPGSIHPEGWSYRNLLGHVPQEDVWAGAAMGAQAMRSLLPSIPHTRAGLRFGSMFVVDDVQHDLKVMFLGEARAERPLELGMMEMLTGRYASWGLCPTRRREDDSRIMLKESYMRYLLVDLLCRVGVSPDGVTILAEHGTAAIRGTLLADINREIERLGHGPDFLKVETSGVYGAPIVQGLFAERPRGNPRFKAMLESSWNLLHNELAMLPGQVGKDRDHAPADIAGRDKDMAALLPVVQAMAKDLPTDVMMHYIAASATGYISYYEFQSILLKAKSLIENRADHRLEGWSECGFASQVATIGGQEVDLDAAAMDRPDVYGELLALVRTLKAPVRMRPMSPMQAWRKCEREQPLVRFPLSLAAIVLGEACGSRATVSERGTLEARSEFQPDRRLVFNAIVKDDAGRVLDIPRGTEVVVNLNPFDPDTLLVCDRDGRYLGANTRPYVAATHGDREADKRNLGLLAQAAASQRERLAPVIAGQQAQRRAAVQRAAGLLKAAMPPDRLSDEAPATLADIQGANGRPEDEDFFPDDDSADVAGILAGISGNNQEQ